MKTENINVWIKKYPFSAICGGLSLLLVAGYFFRQSSVPESEALLADKTSESRQLKNNITYSAQLKEHVALLETANEKVSQRLVRAADLAKNQQYFYKIEAETGVKLMDLRPGGASAPAGKDTPKPTLYSIVPYTCTVQGTYAQLLAFLRKLEDGEHFQRILSAMVALGGSGGGSDGPDSVDPILSLSVSIEFLGQL